MLVSPAAAESMYVAAANAAGENLHVDVVVALGLELVHALVEITPCVGGVDLEADGLIPRQWPGWFVLAGASKGDGGA